MGESFQFIDIVLFGMIAAFLILRLRSVLGRHRDHGRPEEDVDGSSLSRTDDNIISLSDNSEKPNTVTGNMVEADANDKVSDLDTGFAKIQAASPKFDKKEFLVGAATAFEMIIQAFAGGDREFLESLLSDEVYRNFLSAITSREGANETLENTLIRIVSTEPIEAYMEDSLAYVTVKIVSEQINVTRNTKDEVVDGDLEHVSEITDIWTFSRDCKSKDPNWMLVATRSLE